MEVFDTVTRRNVNIDTAFRRGFPSARFRVPANGHVFAIPDRRRGSGFRLDLITDARSIANKRRSAKAQQIYPAQANVTVETSLAAPNR